MQKQSKYRLTRVSFLLLLCATSLAQTQFATPYLLRHGDSKSEDPLLSLTVSTSILQSLRPTVALDAELWNVSVPVLLTSRLGLSLRGSVSIPGIPIQSDTVPEGLRGFLGGGTGIGASAWPYLKLIYFSGLTGFLYARAEQQIWANSIVSPTASDLYAMRLGWLGVCFVADLKRLFRQDSVDSSAGTLIQFDASQEEIRFQNDGKFRSIIRELDATYFRYVRFRLGIQLPSTLLYIDRIKSSSINFWSAGVSVRLI